MAMEFSEGKGKARKIANLLKDFKDAEEVLDLAAAAQSTVDRGQEKVDHLEKRAKVITEGLGILEERKSAAEELAKNVELIAAQALTEAMSAIENKISEAKESTGLRIRDMEKSVLDAQTKAAEEMVVIEKDVGIAEEGRRVAQANLAEANAALADMREKLGGV